MGGWGGIKVNYISNLYSTVRYLTQAKYVSRMMKKEMHREFCGKASLKSAI